MAHTSAAFGPDPLPRVLGRPSGTVGTVRRHAEAGEARDRFGGTDEFRGGGHVASRECPECGGTAAQAMTEGSANFLVNRRMNKAQQMRWSRRGADLLLQVRCAIYNGAFGDGFGTLFEPTSIRPRNHHWPLDPPHFLDTPRSGGSRP
jgi:hypothetical protein